MISHHLAGGLPIHDPDATLIGWALRAIGERTWHKLSEGPNGAQWGGQTPPARSV